MPSLATLVTSLAVCGALLAGCAAAAAAPPTTAALTTPDRYVQVVRDLLDGPTRLGQVAAGQLSPPRRPLPDPDELRSIRSDIPAQLRRLRGLRLGAALRPQRDALARAFPPVIAASARVVRDLLSRDTARLRTDADALYDSLRTLPSRVAALSSPSP